MNQSEAKARFIDMQIQPDRALFSAEVDLEPDEAETISDLPKRELLINCILWYPFGRCQLSTRFNVLLVYLV